MKIRRVKAKDLAVLSYATGAWRKRPDPPREAGWQGQEEDQEEDQEEGREQEVQERDVGLT